MTVNVPLLRKIRDHIVAHPEEHDQTHYLAKVGCGTTRCIAGWATTFTGHDFAWFTFDGFNYSSMTSSGELISDVAERELGVDRDTALHLFTTGTYNAVDALDEIIADAEAES